MFNRNIQIADNTILLVATVAVALAVVGAGTGFVAVACAVSGIVALVLSLALSKTVSPAEELGSLGNAAVAWVVAGSLLVTGIGAMVGAKTIAIAAATPVMVYLGGSMNGAAVYPNEVSLASNNFMPLFITMLMAGTMLGAILMPLTAFINKGSVVAKSMWLVFALFIGAGAVESGDFTASAGVVPLTLCWAAVVVLSVAGVVMVKGNNLTNI